MIALIILSSVIAILLIFISVLLVLINKNLVSYKQDYGNINLLNMKSVSTNFEIVQTLLDEVVHSQRTGSSKFGDDLDQEIIHRGRNALRKKK